MKSFKQSFLVRRNKTEANNSAIVYARIVVDGMRTEFSLQREVNIDLWCAEKSMALGNSRECKELNRYIDTVRLKVFQIYRELVANDKPVSCQIIKEKVLGIDSKEIAMFLDIFKKHNEKFEALIGIDYSRSTLTKYKTCYSTLQEFIKLKYKSDDLEVTKLNYEFLVDFEFFLKTQKRCAHNTVMGYIKKVKKIVRQCVAMDLLDKDPFMAFKITIRDVQRNLLTQDELDLLRLKSLSIVRIGIVRDIFLFCCYTGLSFSDVEKLDRSEIVKGSDGNYWIYTTRTKTCSASRIPLLPAAEQILLKYASDPYCKQTNRALPVLSNQKMNSYLKELAAVCGISKELTFHCARHTFATTVTLTNGVPIETVSKMLGHKSLKTTQHYAKIVDTKVSEDMNPLKDKYR